MNKLCVALAAAAAAFVLLSGCGYPEITLGEAYSGTVTSDSDFYYDSVNIYACYINHHSINVEAGHTYTVTLWAEHGANFEDPGAHGRFVTITNGFEVDSPKSCGTAAGTTTTSKWTIDEGGSFRVNVYSVDIPTKYTITVSQ
jgi:hypothetical protein